MTKVGLYAILRVYLTVFGLAAGASAPDLPAWLVPAALLTMACGALGALASRRLGGLAAQLTLLSTGTMLAVAALASQQALSAALYYLVHSTLTGGLLFLVCGVVAWQRGAAGDGLRRAAQLARPQLSALLFLLAAMAVVGTPPLSGFIAKVMLLQASVGVRAAPWIWCVILASSFVAMLALLRAGVVVFWSVRSGPTQAAPTGVLRFGAPLLLALSLALLALAAEPVKRFTDATAAQLIDPAAYVARVLETPGRP